MNAHEIKVVSNEDLRSKLAMVNERLVGADLNDPTRHEMFLFDMRDAICRELNYRSMDLG